MRITLERRLESGTSDPSEEFDARREAERRRHLEKDLGNAVKSLLAGERGFITASRRTIYSAGCPTLGEGDVAGVGVGKDKDRIYILADAG